MLPDLSEYMWKDINQKLLALQNRLDTLTVRTSFTQTAGGLVRIMFAALPVTNNTSGDLYWCTDGRKVGEGAGLGTGTVVYWNGTTNQWNRIRDDSQVVN